MLFWDLKPQESKFSRSLVHNANFSMKWQIVAKIEHLFCQDWQDSFFWVCLNSAKKMWTTIIFDNFVNKNFRKSFFFDQNCKRFRIIYFYELSIFFWWNLEEVFCLNLDLSLDRINNVGEYIHSKKHNNELKAKRKKPQFYLSQMMM